jgi:plastocyanin
MQPSRTITPFRVDLRTRVDRFSRNALRFLLLSALLVCVSTADGGAVVEGKVELLVPKAPSVRKARYPGGASGPVTAAAPQPAVVYLEGDFSAHAGTGTNAPAAQLRQRNLRFDPPVLPVLRGSRVEFPNLDEEYHNVLSYSKPKELDLGRYLKAEKPPSVTFDKAGVVELGCEIHEHMYGIVLVLDTPFFTTTGSDGRFRLENLPAGTFVLKAWLNPRTIYEQSIELKENEVLRVELPAAPKTR